MPNSSKPIEITDTMLVDGNISSQQIIYKLGVIETKMNSMADNIRDAVKRFEDRVVETRNESQKENATLMARVVLVETAQKEMADWRNQLFTKLGFVVSAISLFWIIFAEPFKKSIEGYFG